MVRRKLKGTKPCPFCNSLENLEITSKKTFKELIAMHGRATISIDCKNCGLNFYELDYNGTDYAIKKEILLKKWNRRAENGVEEDQ